MSYTFPVETSARHVHLTAEDFAVLFGADAQLTLKKELSIKGQFASNEKVTVVGPKKSQANVSILGPFRSKSQVELSATDARSLGLNAPVRLSGDLAGSAPCKLVGPAGEVELSEGVIVAKRHLHISEKKKKKANVANGEVIMVKIASPDRSLIFDDVEVRIGEGCDATMHVDTDESNAAGCTPASVGELIKK